MTDTTTTTTTTIKDRVYAAAEKRAMISFRKLALPNLASAIVTPAKVKLTNYTQVKEFVFKDGHGRQYNEGVRRSTRSASGQRRRIAINAIIDLLGKGLVSSRFADELARVLDGKKKAGHFKRKYPFCGLVPPDLRAVSDYGKHDNQCAVILWIIGTHQTDKSTLDLGEEEEARICALWREETVLWDDRVHFEEWRAANPSYGR